MPIFVVLLLTASCLHVPWPRPPFGLGGSGSLALTAFAFLLPISAAIVLSRWAVSAVEHDPERRLVIARKYTRYRHFLGYFHLLVAAIAIIGLGWGWTIWNRAVLSADRPLLAPMAELLVPAPYLLTILFIWIIHYDAEHALHVSNESADQPFWSRVGHFLFQIRPFAFMVLLPVTIFAAQQSFIRLAPNTAGELLTQIGAALLLPVLFLVLPLLVKPALGLCSLPQGPIRDRFEEIARRVGFRYSDLLLWPTQGQMVNAFVVGIVPRARFVVFTDRLLDSLSPDEQDAVFGHEIGHAKHAHLPFYLIFFMLSVIAVTVAVTMGMATLVEYGWIDEATWLPWAGLPPLAFLLVYLFVVFGFLSRRCERQADLYGCRVVSGGSELSPHGVDSMIQALVRVGEMSGMDPKSVFGNRPGLIRRLLALFRSWLHGTIAERVRFLMMIRDNPAREPGVQLRITLLKWVLIVLLVASVIAIGFAVGWEEILRAL